jgi:hypothetical protein
VTSTYHVPRAIGVFRKVGFTVEPYPVDWRTRGTEDAVTVCEMSDGCSGRHCRARMDRLWSLAHRP